MGLLQRRSVFLNDEGSVKKDQSRGRKGSMPSSKSSPQIGDKELPKRRSLANILRSWKKDDSSSPLPPLPMPNAKFSGGRDSALPSPLSPMSPVTPSGYGRPQSHFGNGNGSQAGVCSTFSVQRPAYASSVTLPNFIPGPKRFYTQGGAGPADSTSSFGASRSTLHISPPPLPSTYSYSTYPSPSSPMTISSPIPGFGDVPPIRYNDFLPPPSEIGVALTMPPDNSPHLSVQKRESRQRISRLSIQTTQTIITSSSHVSTNASSHSHHSQTASRKKSLPPTPSSVSILQPASNRQSTSTIKPAASRRASRQLTPKTASEADFLLDAEVAALLSDAQMPPAEGGPIPPNPSVAVAHAALEGRPLSEVAETEPPHSSDSLSALHVPPPRRSSAIPEMASLPPPPRQSFASLRPPLRTVEMSSNISSPPMHSPSSTSYESARSSPAFPSPGLQTSNERLTAPVSPRPDSLLSTASWGSSAASRLSGRQGMVERSSIPWIRDPSPGHTPELSPSEGSEHVEALDETPKKSPRFNEEPMFEQPAEQPAHAHDVKSTDEVSQRSTSSLSHCPTALLSPVSSAFDDHMQGVSSSASGDFHGVGLGVLVPGPRNRSPTGEIAGLKSRNSVLETTNARLEAELHQARSNPARRSNVASMYSMHSAMTVRDDQSIGWPLSMHGSSLDLAVPTLVAEIDQLKRSGALLQAELQAVKSQVSLLLPPTPHELAETEVKDGHVHGESYVPSETYVAPAGHVQEIHTEDEDMHDADDERYTPTPHGSARTPIGNGPTYNYNKGQGHARQGSSGQSDVENSVSSHYSHASVYSTSSADSASPLTPDTSTDWPVLPPMMSLASDQNTDAKGALLTPARGDRSSVVSFTSGGAPLTKLPVRTHSRPSGLRNSRVAPVNVSKANALKSSLPGSDPTTPKARPRAGARNTLQPAPRSAVTPRTSMFNAGSGIPPPRPPRRRPVTVVPRDTIVQVGA